MIISLPLLTTLFLIQTKTPLAFLATWEHGWLLFSQSSTSTPRSISSTQSSRHSAPSWQWCLGLLWPKCRTQHLILLNPIPLASAQLSNLSRSLCKASVPSGRSTLPASLVSSANLLRVHSIPSSRSSVKILKRTENIFFSCTVLWYCLTAFFFLAEKTKQKPLEHWKKVQFSTHSTLRFECEDSVIWLQQFTSIGNVDSCLSLVTCQHPYFYSCFP